MCRTLTLMAGGMVGLAVAFMLPVPTGEYTAVAQGR